VTTSGDDERQAGKGMHGDGEPILETRYGALRGRRQDGLAVFRGVPYAAPPVGPLRLRPPRPPKPWEGLRDALEPGPAAPQLPGGVAAALGASLGGGAEDCLRLDIWTPGPGGSRRPILVWLHGGGFATGAGSLPLYDGSTLAREGDAVVVTVGYRLGILGWLALPELAEPAGSGVARADGEDEADAGAAGNFGLLDQIAALRWVREHAHALGGDPENVTVFGESAGAMSVGVLLGCPRARGLFRRAILQSGAAHNVYTPEEAAPVTRAVLDALGVGPRSLERLRTLPLEAVLAAQRRVLEAPLPEVRQLRFQPVIDGEILPRHPLEAVAAGSAAGVEVMAGTNLDEYRLWSLTDRRAEQLDEAALLRRCRRNIPGEHPVEGPHAERAVRTYREARRPHLSTEPPDLWYAIESDRIFRYPAMRLLDLQRAHAPGVRAYLFTWSSPALGGRLGSCHALELPFVFGQIGLPALRRFVGEDPGAEALSARMRAAWLAFTRGEAPEGWPAYGERDRSAGWNALPERPSAPSGRASSRRCSAGSCSRPSPPCSRVACCSAIRAPACAAWRPGSSRPWRRPRIPSFPPAAPFPSREATPAFPPTWTATWTPSRGGRVCSSGRSCSWWSTPPWCSRRRGPAAGAASRAWRRPSARPCWRAGGRAGSSPGDWSSPACGRS